MPELPEVQTVVDELAVKITGKKIVRTQLNRQDILTPADFDFEKATSGKTIANVSRRAKRIVITLKNDERFYIHLGMSGRITIEPHDAPIQKHTHAIFHFKDFEVRFRDPRRFGGIWWLGNNEDDDSLGPEPLQMKASQLATRLHKTTRAIKTALLDQKLIAGLGNIYVDEALHEAGIYPSTKSDRLTKQQIEKLTRAIKTVLRRAIKHRGSTLRDYVNTTGNAGAFQKLHRVYAREGKPCLHCGCSIDRIVMGGRSTHFCKICQPRRKNRALASTHRHD